MRLLEKQALSGVARMNGKLSVRFSTILLSIMCLTLIAIPYIPQGINNLIKLILEIILVMWVVSHKISKKSVFRAFPMFLFFIAICVCTYHAMGMRSRLANAVVTGGAYFSYYFIISNYSEIYGIDYVGKIVRKNLLFYMIILDLFAILTWGKGLGGLDEAVYLLGNKFMISYTHMLVLSFINFEDRSKKTSGYMIKMIAFFIYSCAICLLSDTTTGIVGLTCVLFLSIISVKKQILLDILRRPIVVLAFFLGIHGIFLLTDTLIGNSTISAFFYSRSHTNTMLSGRFVMYNIVIEAIGKNPIWGYGINCELVKNTLGFGNPQNGILKMLLDYGIIGTACFCLTLYTTFKNAFGKNNLEIKNECIIFIYAMMVCSLVEINLAGMFMMVCALLNSSEPYNSIAEE